MTLDLTCRAQTRPSGKKCISVLLCFVYPAFISLGKTAESEEIQSSQQIWRLNVIIFTFIIEGADVMLIIWSPYALMCTKDSRSASCFCSPIKRSLWTDREEDFFFYPPALQILPSFLCLPVREFFLLLLKYWYAKKEDISKRMFYSTEGGFEMRKEGGKKCNTVGRLALFPCFTTNT